jgi:sulfide:quinone oxidoreductase
VLEERGVTIHKRATCTEFTEGKLTLGGGESLAADRAIALPRLVGPALAGVPQDADGFIPVDRHCRVEGLSRVFAAGDVTDFPLKQGGLAAQQADAAVEALAADLGLHVEPQPFAPTLRGILLTGEQPHYLRARVGEDGQLTSETAAEPLWWPPGKIAARLLAPHLAERGHGVAVSDRELVDQEPGGAADTVGSAQDIAAVAELAAALATVDVAWVTPTSLRPRRDS